MTSFSRFTNCIATCLWTGGVNHTPSILFTSDPDFNYNRKKTVCQKEIQNFLRMQLKRHGISRNRVVFVGDIEGYKGTYVRESPFLVQEFFKHYKLDYKKCYILSDSGKSFKEKETDVLTRKVGFAKHIAYPPPIHQYLSVNDNRLHGVGKKKVEAKMK